eukprot:8958958-Pyramimonas_sp.AAC.1
MNSVPHHNGTVVVNARPYSAQAAGCASPRAMFTYKKKSCSHTRKIALTRASARDIEQNNTKVCMQILSDVDSSNYVRVNCSMWLVAGKRLRSLLSHRRCCTLSYLVSLGRGLVLYLPRVLHECEDTLIIDKPVGVPFHQNEESPGIVQVVRRMQADGLLEYQ